MNKLFLIILVGVVFLLSGCSDFRQATGREKIKFDALEYLRVSQAAVEQHRDLDISLELSVRSS